MDIGIWEGRQRRIVSADQRMIGRQQLRIGKNQELVVTRGGTIKVKRKKRKERKKEKSFAGPKMSWTKAGLRSNPKARHQASEATNSRDQGRRFVLSRGPPCSCSPAAGASRRKAKLATRGGNELSSLLLAIFAGGGEDGKNKAGQLFLFSQGVGEKDNVDFLLGRRLSFEASGKDIGQDKGVWRTFNKMGGEEVGREETSRAGIKPGKGRVPLPESWRAGAMERLITGVRTVTRLGQRERERERVCVCVFSCCVHSGPSPGQMYEVPPPMEICRGTSRSPELV